MITHCSNCDNVTEDTRKRQSYYWTCIKHKRVASTQFVAEGLLDQDSPYLRCSAVNGGACLLFEPKRENDNGSNSSSSD